MAKLRSDDRIRIHCISVRLNNNELQILILNEVIKVKVNGSACYFCKTCHQ